MMKTHYLILFVIVSLTGSCSPKTKSDVDQTTNHLKPPHTNLYSVSEDDYKIIKEGDSISFIRKGLSSKDIDYSFESYRRGDFGTIKIDKKNTTGDYWIIMGTSDVETSGSNVEIIVNSITRNGKNIKLKQ